MICKIIDLIFLFDLIVSHLKLDSKLAKKFKIFKKLFCFLTVNVDRIKYCIFYIFYDEYIDTKNAILIYFTCYF